MASWATRSAVTICSRVGIRARRFASAQPVVLRVGQFEAVRAERGGQLDDLTDAIEIRPVEDDVDREGKSELAQHRLLRASSESPDESVTRTMCADRLPGGETGVVK
jgi:hypothetical protein